MSYIYKDGRIVKENPVKSAVQQELNSQLKDENISEKFDSIKEIANYLSKNFEELESIKRVIRCIPTQIDSAINKLNVEDTAIEDLYISSVSESAGKIQVTRSKFPPFKPVWSVLNERYLQTKQYFTVEALNDGLSVRFTQNNLQYRIDDGEWNTLEINTLTPSINKNQKIQFKIDNPNVSSLYGIGTFYISKPCNISGNIMSLLYGDNFINLTNLIGKDYVFKLLFKTNPIRDAKNLILPATILSAYCYEEMFTSCTHLTTAPELLATTLAEFCYSGMFSGCKDLTKVPKLPATVLKDYCYLYMFSSSGITEAPDLPATTLANGCYFYMFNGCKSLTKVSDLPALSLMEYSYSNMFYGCDALLNAPEIYATETSRYCCESMFLSCLSLLVAPTILAATTLSENCYLYMFCDCNALIKAPEILATTVAENCCHLMFYNCKSLTTAPTILPAMTLANYCYWSMFYGCESLKTAPELPATTLAYYCYNSMFQNCISLTTAPKELPATTLANYCYRSMFSGCKKLIEAPKLPATTLADYCYIYMFKGCTKLNNITMLAINTSADNCLYDWVYGVSSSGTFIKHPEMTSLSNGSNGVPLGWVIEDYAVLLDCISLEITADDVVGNDTTTTIYYTAKYNALDIYNNPIVVEKTGKAKSEEFPQNTSETETIERILSFTYMGITATTTITLRTWLIRKYTIDLNNNWQVSAKPNPDSTLYDGVYESYSNKGKHSTSAIMYIDIEGYSNFKLYIRSYAQLYSDYVMVSQLDKNINNSTYSSSTLVKAHTEQESSSGTTLDDYKLVEFTGIDYGKHRITIVYKKDSYGSSGDDRGYVLIEK